MSIGKLPSEKEFLIKLAVDRFNQQFNKRINPKECTVHSIPRNYQREYGYEVVTRRQDDFLRLRIYFNIVGIDSLRSYRLEVDNSYKVQEKGDEVYVALGNVNPYYRDSGTYNFRWIERDLEAETGMLYMPGDFITLMSGGHLEEMP